MSLKKIMIASVLTGGVLLGFKACHDENAQNDQIKTDFNAAWNNISHHYNGNIRLQRILAAQGTVMGGFCGDFSVTAPDGYFDTCREMGKRYFDIEKFQLSLASNLPGEAVIQVFKDRIIFNAYSNEQVQASALTKVMDYIAQQKRDGLPYGDGESFTIGLGELQRVGKNAYAYPQTLLPAPGY